MSMQTKCDVYVNAQYNFAWFAVETGFICSAIKTKHERQSENLFRLLDIRSGAWKHYVKSVLVLDIPRLIYLLNVNW